jgi:hypothetical protein
MTRTMSETLRAVADLLAAHPDLPLLPYVTLYGHRPERADLTWSLHINGNAIDAADQKAKAALILRTLGGKWNKDFEWGDTDRADFAQARDGLHLRVVVQRSAVCERVVVGEETVTLPAVEAQPERTATREVVEWRCEPVLAEVSA